MYLGFNSCFPVKPVFPAIPGDYEGDVVSAAPVVTEGSPNLEHRRPEAVHDVVNWVDPGGSLANRSWKERSTNSNKKST